MIVLARRYLLFGRVQGVGFRYFTSQKARKLGIRGWVRNLSSGEVEVQAEAEEGSLNQFEDCLRRGPSLALVDDFQVEDKFPENFEEFSIRR